MPLLQLSMVGYEDAPQRAPQADLIMGYRSTEVCLKSFRCQEILGKLRIQSARCDFAPAL
jgi:hypothetical protein